MAVVSYSMLFIYGSWKVSFNFIISSICPSSPLKGIGDSRVFWNGSIDKKDDDGIDSFHHSNFFLYIFS